MWPPGLVVVEQGALAPSLQQAAEGLGIASRTRFVGRVPPEVPPGYAALGLMLAGLLAQFNPLL